MRRAGTVLAIPLLISACSQDPTPPLADTAPPESVHFHQIIRLAGGSWPPLTPGKSPWSASGRYLALWKSEGIELHRFGHADTALILLPRALDVAWAPSGDWIALLLGDSSERRILVVDAASGDSSEVYRGPPVWPMLWASDGAIYAWRNEEARPLRFEPPATWQGRHASGLRPVRHVVYARPTLDLALLRPGRRWEIQELPEVSSYSNNGFLIRGSNEHHTLVSFAANDDDGDLLLDRDGNLVGRIPVRGDSMEVDWNSLSPDSRYCLGAREIGDGHVLFSSALVLGGVRQPWRIYVRSAGHAMQPHFAPDGVHVAFEDPIERGVVIGSIQVLAP